MLTKKELFLVMDVVQSYSLKSPMVVIVRLLVGAAAVCFALLAQFRVLACSRGTTCREKLHHSCNNVMAKMNFEQTELNKRHNFAQDFTCYASEVNFT